VARPFRYDPPELSPGHVLRSRVRQALSGRFERQVTVLVEAAHRVLIAAHLELGDVAAARRALSTCHSVLEELGGPAEPATHELERRLERV
jgi:hypothetical protein